MKKIGELMEELGFKKEAPDTVKKAFLKNLFNQIQPRPEILDVTDKSPEPVQLQFDLDDTTESAA